MKQVPGCVRIVLAYLSIIESVRNDLEKGDVLGIITDPYGGPETKVKARKDGIIFGHNNKPVINQGDALFHIGYSK